MHNINELIGIIRGINFDNIINEKEVVRLQSWIDKNRNLVYDPSQHDYSVDKPSFQEIKPGHFIWANEKEMEEYRKKLQ